MRPFALLLLLACVIPGVFVGATSDDGVEPKTARGWLERGTVQYGKRQFKEAVESFTKAINLDAKLAEAYNRRGEAHFLLSKFSESVKDFDKYLALAPEAAAGHWQRGISLYYAGKYDEGKKQFEGYEKVDTNDVENAVWHFICWAKKDGKLDNARKGILKIGKDKRTPMMQVYEMFKGTLKPADVLAAANAGKLSELQRKPQMFYAHLYLGIYYDITGDQKKAIEHLALASEKYRGHHFYMGEVARVHHEMLMKKKK